MKYDINTIHTFKVEDAIRYGTDKAVILAAIRHFIDVNKWDDNSKYFRDDYYWFCISSKGLSKVLPYFTPSKVQRLLKQLENDRAIVARVLNDSAFNRTKWYSLPEHYSKGM